LGSSPTPRAEDARAVDGSSTGRRVPKRWKRESIGCKRVQFDDETWEAVLFKMSPSTELLAYAALALVAYAVALLLLWLWL
jgi:hypothetical protein